jgi:hypothetical protein
MHTFSYNMQIADIFYRNVDHQPSSQSQCYITQCRRLICASPSLCYHQKISIFLVSQNMEWLDVIKLNPNDNAFSKFCLIIVLCNTPPPPSSPPPPPPLSPHSRAVVYLVRIIWIIVQWSESRLWAPGITHDLTVIPSCPFLKSHSIKHRH